ncbi:matrixin family metalloprotease [Flavihumibacter petaseus]|uniref:Peptidase M10 metallopeptidase domain-containing protein n=1 Tax=Flavihumibacter petaseus NBRC 106054 TaxID=1220578 RepID=A0A0E9N0S2_9BACT|nr:matrixin family metalloprotease [Flavihumibacter petaseus]GAO43429.1 hypothetical protein FPE01S_02_05340 [Flavihumibacter petaseus NBRC 106054]
MKPLSTLLLASASWMLFSCAKKDELSDHLADALSSPGKQVSGVNKPGDLDYTVMPASAFSKHHPVLLKAEYMRCQKRGNNDNATILYNDKKTKPDAEFVTRDPRRGGRRVITYAIGNAYTRDFGVSKQAVNNAIDRAMNNWSESSCSRLIFKKVTNEESIGYVASQIGFGGWPTNIADLQHAGFLPRGFFDALTPDGGSFVLAVTFTFVYFGDDGLPTDIDHNGVNDVAFRETYYNDNFNWRNSQNTDYDIESVALHETGHALGLSHFGTGYQLRNGDIRFRPRAVMNAVYVGSMRHLQREDKSFQCSIWNDWNQ